MDDDAQHWLNKREARAWQGFHQMWAQLNGHLARELAHDSAMTESEYAVLATLSEAPGGRLRARDLGRELGWERSRLSHQIRRMEARGSVTRAACDDDGRGFDITITPVGTTTITAAAPKHLAAVRTNFIDLLTDDQLDTLAEIGDVVAEHLRSTYADPASAKHSDDC